MIGPDFFLPFFTDPGHPGLSNDLVDALFGKYPNLLHAIKDEPDLTQVRERLDRIADQRIQAAWRGTPSERRTL